MHIERIQIEDGFLDGFNLKLVSGLNVIIGARGTGKTSLIELIRYCLGSSNLTPTAARNSLEHARAVLAAGQTVVTIAHEAQQTVVLRSAQDREPRSATVFQPPLILSQTEIETVGLEAQGRLRLIDEFVRDRGQFDIDEAAAAAEVRSQTEDIDSLRKEMTDLQQQISTISEIDQQLLILRPQEEALTKLSSQAGEKKKRLDALVGRTTELSVSASYVERFQEGFKRWRSVSERVFQTTPLPDRWSSSPPRPDPLAEVRSKISQLRSLLQEAQRLAGEIGTISEAAAESYVTQRVTLDDQTRALRKEVDDIQKGAGAIARQAQALREQKARLIALKGVLSDTEQRLKTLIGERNASLDSLEEIRTARFNSRNKVITALNSALGPRIRTAIERAGQHEQYVGAVSAALRGSGLHYNDLAAMIGSQISPRELIDAVESSDIDLLVEVLQISKDRAIRVINALREANLGELATCSVEDKVDLQLLDGGDYKSIQQLSTGQRCTVILPIILEHKDRILIVDQPEDHIDNAFIADTLIPALRRSSAQKQMILSTHNANIPVLGEAQKVVHLGSDGRRGFVETEGKLESPAIVQAITTLMEGGAEAFRKRAAFYKAHQS